jgi:SNF2 family DNA or RNA helicase
LLVVPASLVGNWKAEVAKFATNLIIESYLIDKNWAAVEEVAKRLRENKDVIDPKSDLYAQLTKFELGGKFKRAEERNTDEHNSSRHGRQ